MFLKPLAVIQPAICCNTDSLLKYHHYELSFKQNYQFMNHIYWSVQRKCVVRCKVQWLEISEFEFVVDPSL